MKTIALALAGLLVVASPAFAQGGYGYGGYGAGSGDPRIDALHYRIDEGMRRGTISRGEAPRLTDQLWAIRRLEGQYARNGFTRWERTDLDRRIAFLEDQLRGAGDRDYGRDGAGYDRYDDHGIGDTGAAPPMPDDDYGYGSDDQAYGQYDDPDDDASGIRPIDPDSGYALLDNGATSEPGYSDPYDDPDGPGDYGYDGLDEGPVGPGPGASLRVGDPAPAYLGTVPPDLRGLYRDGSGLTYRFDGERVYQIDARTNRIRWIGEIR
jgi:hypothetical protein